ncbi:class I SAM-dependent methyltransferase [Sellimonas intestinalis]|uniref:class I SAM-dependent methyltransferase n=1 Tax=Sellimonas intestinalis TaxID=1653434 RepID=UPI003994CBCA
MSRLAFHHFPNPKRCFSEMARVLKTGGKLVVIDMEAAEEALRNTENEIETLRDPLACA